MRAQARCDRRGPQRYPTFGPAFVFAETGEMVECIVRDISDWGACLHGDGISALPSQFEAWLPAEGVSGAARIIWRNRHACGIVFEDEKPRTVLKQRIARFQRDDSKTDRMVALLKATKHRMSGSVSEVARSHNEESGKRRKPAHVTPGTVSRPNEELTDTVLCKKDDSIDHITRLVRSRLVKTVLQGRSTATEADILRRILSDLNLLRRSGASQLAASPPFGRK